MSYQFIKDLSIGEFNSFASKHELKRIYQTYSWGLVKDNWKTHLVGVKEDGKIIAACMIMFRKLIGSYTVGYITRGPLIDYDNNSILEFFIKSIKTFGKQQNAVFIKFDPNIKIEKVELKEKDTVAGLQSLELVERLKKCGAIFNGYEMDFHKTIQPRIQLNFPISDDYKQRLPKDTLKKLKKSDMYGVVVKEGKPEDMHRFMEMIHKTEERKGIALRDEKYFYKMRNAFRDNHTLLIATIDYEQAFKKCEEEIDTLSRKLVEKQFGSKHANNAYNQLYQLGRREEELHEDAKDYKEGTPIAALLVLEDGETAELLYSGFDERYKKYFPAYALRCRAIEWAKDRGCKWFNFGGVQGDFKGGLYEFKSQFNPLIDVYIGEFDIPCNQILYKCFCWLMPKAKVVMKKIRKR